MLAPESIFWICLGKCAHWLLEIQDSRNRLSEWGVIMGTNRAFFGEYTEIQGAGNALSGTLYTDR